MPDLKQPARAARAGAAALAILVAGAVADQSPRTRASEGDAPVSYRDPGGVWTGGNGHTGPDVRPHMRVSDAQRAAWLKADLTQHTAAALADTPELAEVKSALEAAGDFHFNAGPRWWAGSPMRAHFRRREWRAGCEAFRGYVISYRAPRAVPGRLCTRSAGAVFCQLPGLIKRREGERATCLSGLPR